MTTRTKPAEPTIRRPGAKASPTLARFLLTSAVALGLAASAGSALADPHGHRGWDDDWGRYEYRPHHHHPYYRPAPVVVYPPYAAPYYAPPPPRVVYEPTYYYPPRPAGVTIGVNVPPIVIPLR